MIGEASYDGAWETSTSKVTSRELDGGSIVSGSMSFRSYVDDEVAIESAATPASGRAVRWSAGRHADVAAEFPQNRNARVVPCRHVTAHIPRRRRDRTVSSSASGDVPPRFSENGRRVAGGDTATVGIVLKRIGVAN